MKTTNYKDTFIEVAADCPVSKAEVPPVKGEQKSVANLQFDMIYEHPYTYTSDDVIFKVYATRNSISEDMLATEREVFFSKGQPCLRTSPLAKRYGWGIHSDENGKVAIYGVDSQEYESLANDSSLKHTKAVAAKRQ